MHRSVSTHDPRRVARTTVRVVILLSAVLTIVFLFSFVFSKEGITQLQRSQARVSELDAEIARLRAENASLKKTLADLDHSNFTVERIAREDLGMAKAGETVYVLPESLDPAPAKPAEPKPHAGN